MNTAPEIDDRLQKCQRILDGDPNSQIFAALAEAYRKRGELDKAFRICQNGLRIHPSYASAHLVMAKINLDRGLYDWAETEVRKAIDLEGANRTTELLLAEIHIYKGEFSHAIKLLKKLHQTDAGNPQISKLLEIAQRLPDEQSAINVRPEEARLAIATSAVTPTPDALAAGPLDARGILTAAIGIPLMQGGLYVNRDGLVVDTEWTISMDASLCGAIMAEVNAFCMQELMKSSFGRVKTVLIETPDPILYMVRAGKHLFVFVGEGKINLGTLRMRIGSLMERYQE